MPDHPCPKPIHSRRGRRTKERSESEKSCVSHPPFSMEAFLNEHCHSTRCSLFGACGGTEVSLSFFGGSTHCRAIGSTVSTGERHSAGRMLSPRWPTSLAPPPQDGCSWSVCACVPSPMCTYIHVRAHRGPDAYLKNKELLIGMIFPFLLSSIFILKFHYLLCQGHFFFFQGTRLQEYPFGCLGPTSLLLPRKSPPSLILPAQFLGAGRSRKAGANQNTGNICTLRPLPIEEKKSQNCSFKGKYQSIIENDPLQ